MELLREEGYETEMIPGVASFSAVAARLGVSLTTMEEPLHILPASQQAQWEGLTLPGTKVLMKTGKQMKTVKEQIKASGSEAMMIQNCGMPDEHIYNSVEEIPDDAGYYSLIIAKEKAEEK